MVERTPNTPWNRRNLPRIGGHRRVPRTLKLPRTARGIGMFFSLRGSLIAATAALGCIWTSYAAAGDDGAAPLWVGIGSIFGPAIGFGKEEKPAIDYREHGKIVLPPKMELPPPNAAAGQAEGEWPVDQEVQRKKIAKEQAKKEIAGQGDARLRYTHPFPNAPVTIRAADQQDSGAAGADGKAAAPSVLGNLNPMGWVGMGKSVPLGPEPNREWLTDPPQGYRAPIGPVGQASK